MTNFFFINEKYLSIDKNGKEEIYDKIVFGNEFVLTYKNKQWKNEGEADFPFNIIPIQKYLLEPVYPVHIYKNSNSKEYYFTDNDKIIVCKNGKFKKYQFADVITNICIDNKNQIWISFSDKGLIVYKSLESLTEVFALPSSGKFQKDKTGNIWHCSSYFGLYKFPSSGINSFQVDSMNIISVSLPMQNHLFLGSYNSYISKFYFKINDKKNCTSSKSNLIWLEDIVKNLNFKNDDKIETYGNNYLTSKTDSYFVVRSFQKIGDTIISFSRTEFLIYNLLTDRKSYIPITVNNQKDFYWHNADSIFIGANDGLRLFNANTRKIKYLFEDKLIKEEHIQVIKRVGNYLLLGTKGKGVLLFSLANKKVLRIYNLRNSFIPNSINCISIMDNYIWIGSNLGITFCKINDGKIEFVNHLDLNSGLSENDILSMKIIDSTIYATALNTVNLIDLKNKELYKKELPIAPTIQNIYVNNTNIGFVKNFTTDYLNNDIEISFNTPYFQDNSRLSYDFKFSNTATEWENTKLEKLKFNNVPAGTYTFSVRSNLESGYHFSKASNLIVTITIPFWRTKWFLSIVSISIILTLLFIYWNYLNERIASSKRKQELIEYQQQALRSQLKPHFIFNVLNSIQNYILKHNVEMAISFIERFAKLTRGILNNSDKEYLSIKQELDLLVNYIEMEKLRFENFEFQIEIDPLINVNEHLIPTLILQPLVENAIWHGLQPKLSKGLLIIRIYIKDKFLCIEVDGNGVGRKFKENKGHKSKGTSLIQKRLKLINIGSENYKVIDKIEGNKSAGTKVCLTLEIKKAI